MGRNQTGVKNWGSPKFYGQEASGLNSLSRMTDGEWDAL